ncbi:MAG: hypothetical protein R2771_09980 [Saprospiraceae bacterium]
MRSFLSAVFILFIYITSSAQSHLLFGEWKSYLPYKSYKISETENKIYCNSELSLYSVDKEDFSVDIFDKTNLLSDVEIVQHCYDSFNNQLILIYKNGNIDIISDDKI